MSESYHPGAQDHPRSASTESKASEGERPAGPSPDEASASIRDALKGLKFGVVSIIVQDGIVVQIDRTEKRRLTRAKRC